MFHDEPNNYAEWTLNVDNNTSIEPRRTRPAISHHCFFFFCSVCFSSAWPRGTRFLGDGEVVFGGWNGRLSRLRIISYRKSRSVTKFRLKVVDPYPLGRPSDGRKAITTHRVASLVRYYILYRRGRTDENTSKTKYARNSPRRTTQYIQTEALTL